MRSPAPPPPEGVLKMKKSLTMDGSSTGGSKGSSKGMFGRPSGGFLFPSKNKGEKDKEKESSGGIGGFMRGKKRNSQGGGGGGGGGA
jgi:hypothetical protein